MTPGEGESICDPKFNVNCFTADELALIDTPIIMRVDMSSYQVWAKAFQSSTYSEPLWVQGLALDPANVPQTLFIVAAQDQRVSYFYLFALNPVDGSLKIPLVQIQDFESNVHITGNNLFAFDDTNVMIATAYTSKSSTLVLAYNLINDPSALDLRKESYRLDGADSLYSFHFGSVAMSEDKIYIGGRLNFSDKSESQPIVTVLDKWSYDIIW